MDIPDIKLLHLGGGPLLIHENYSQKLRTDLVAGEPLFVKFQAKGIPLENIELSIFNPDQSSVVGEVIPIGDGMFYLEYTPPALGFYKVEIKLNGMRVSRQIVFQCKRNSSKQRKSFYGIETLINSNKNNNNKKEKQTTTTSEKDLEDLPPPGPPLVASSSSPSSPSSNIGLVASSHEELDAELANYFKNLFIQLETTEDRKSYKLELRQKNWNRFMKEASSEKDSMPFVIGLIGDTHVGKSSIVLPLIDRLTSEELLKIIFQNRKNTNKDSFSGTSANIHLFKSEGGENKLYIFDMEGTSANGIPTLLQRAILYLSQNASGMYKEGLQYLLTDPIKRNQATKQLLPTLVYLMCDLIIFISTDTFHNSSFMEKAIEFVRGIKAPPRGGIQPHLLLISNKLTFSDGIWDIKLCTEKFLELETSNNGQTVKAKEILNLWYDNVVCICLPNWNEAMLMRTSDIFNPRADPVGCKKFVEQMFELKAIIDDQVKHRSNLRKEKGFHISEKTYLELMKLLIDEMPHSGVTFKHMKGILDYYYEIIQHVTDDVKRVNLIFQHLLTTIINPETPISDSYQQFQKISTFGMEFLACQIALKVRVVFSGSLFGVSVQDKWKQQAREMIQLIDEQRFCYSVFTHKECQVEVGRDVEFRCLVPKMQHINKHFTGPLFEPHTKWNVVKKVYYEMRKFFGFPYYPRWDGAFEPHPNEGDMVEEDLMAVFQHAIKVTFEQETKPALLSHTISILKSATNGKLFSIFDMVEHEPGSGIHREDLCLACLSPISLNEQLCCECVDIWNLTE